jgi:hypothetical protein
MFRRFTLLLALAGLMLINRSTLAEDKPDPSTPKGAASAFFKAMETGDAAAARDMATGSEKQLAILDILVPVVHGFKQLEIAAVKKWGDEGRKTLTQGQGGGGSFDFNEQIKTAKEEITGETAIITPAQAGEDKKDPMKLKKVDGKWKLDMASIPAEGIEDPTTTKMLKAMADIAKSTAAEIDEGKYESAAKAKEAMGQKILPLIMAAQGNANEQPTEQPKKEDPKK